VPNFTPIGATCRHCGAENLKIGLWGRKEGGRKLIRQISSECVHCVGFRWPKTTILAVFNIYFWWDSYTHPLLPMRVKFGVLEQTQDLHCHAKFHLNELIVSDSGGEKPQFCSNFDVLGAPVPTPFYG